MSEVVQKFHDLFYNSTQFIEWFGVPIQKNPCDLWMYQEVIWKTKPDLILECGTQTGGSAFFFASMLDWIGRGGQVITIDVDGRERWPERPEHPRINYVAGDSASPGLKPWIKKQAKDGRIMVSLDSDHSKEHVRKEMDLYGDLVSPGCYMVVEDGDVTDAWVAVEEYVSANPEFVVDKKCEKYLLTYNPGGWLLRT